MHSYITKFEQLLRGHTVDREISLLKFFAVVTKNENLTREINSIIYIRNNEQKHMTFRAEKGKYASGSTVFKEGG